MEGYSFNFMLPLFVLFLLQILSDFTLALIGVFSLPAFRFLFEFRISFLQAFHYHYIIPWFLSPEYRL
jgi:hypothetical protein